MIRFAGTILGVGLATVLVVAPPARAGDAPAAMIEPAMDATTVLRLENAALRRRLTEAQLWLLERAGINLQWEMEEIRRQHRANQTTEAETVADLAKAAGVDAATHQPDLDRKVWVKKK